MSTYLVIKRMVEDRVYLPDEILVDPPQAAILMQRGYIIPVADNYKSPSAVQADLDAKAEAKAKTSKSAKKADADTGTEVPPRDPAEVTRLAKAMEVTEAEVLALNDKDFGEAAAMFLNESSTGNDLADPGPDKSKK